MFCFTELDFDAPNEEREYSKMAVISRIRSNFMKRTAEFVFDGTKKVQKSSLINSNWFTEPFKAKFKESFNIKPTSNAEFATFPEPSSVAFIDNMIQPDFIEKVVEDLSQEPYFRKSNDLYEFLQSDDLKLSQQPHLIELRNAIYSTEFTELMSEFTGCELLNTVDMSSHRYPPNGYLLCHDDDIGNDVEGRRIAFILYLTPTDWKEEEGGLLEFYDLNAFGQPEEKAISLLPKRNRFAFFVVSPDSHHQVSEVLGNRERLSISGWFHGPLPTAVKAKEIISDAYLSESTLAQIKDTFINQSSVELTDFLSAEFYAEFVKELEEEASWSKQCGPANQFRYKTLPRPRGNAFKLRSFLSSAAFAEFLESATSMRLKHYKSVIRKFESGDYTLLHDSALEKEGVEVVFNCLSCEWREEWGGSTHFLSSDEHLLTCLPRSNTLRIVFHDKGVMSFVKYVNRNAAESSMTEFKFEFSE